MQVQKRSEIEEKYKWKLEDIFASDADWEAEFAQAEALLPQLEAQKECITRDTQSMLAGLKLIDQASLLLERLYVYARMPAGMRMAPILFIRGSLRVHRAWQ